MKKNNFQKLSGEWFQRANEDLLFAKAGFKETGIARDACFLSQQVAEKYLKGFLVANGKEPGRTHVLPELLSECVKINKKFLDIKKECEFLNRFYNPARYPDAALLHFNKEAAEQALIFAESIVGFIGNIIGEGL